MFDERYWELQRTLSAEFSKYVLSRPEINGKIPDNAQIVFRIKGDTSFNEWSEKVSRAQKEPGQPVLIVEVDGLLESRLINPQLEVASK